MSFPRPTALALSGALGLSLLTSACGPAALTVVSYGADGVSYAESGKSTTDHLASIVTKKDCAFLRILRSEKVCREREGDHDPYQVEYDQPTRQPSEDGMSYAPPLRTSASAPAASWTADTFKPAPTEPPTAAPVPVAPATAAEAPRTAPAPSADASSQKQAKVRAAKVRAYSRPVKKASPDRVASAP